MSFNNQIIIYFILSKFKKNNNWTRVISTKNIYKNLKKIFNLKNVLYNSKCSKNYPLLYKGKKKILIYFNHFQMNLPSLNQRPCKSRDTKFV